MSGRLIKFIEIVIVISIVMTLSPALYGQCNAFIYNDVVEIDRNGRTTFNVPIYLENDCPVAGVQFDILAYGGIIRPVDADTTNGRVSYFEIVGRTQLSSSRLRFAAVADDPFAGDTTDPLIPGEGLLVNIEFAYGGNYDCNVPVLIGLDSVVVADTAGFDFDDIQIGTYAVLIGDDVTPDLLRGDVNGNGNTQSSDVTYLVNYFRGVNNPPIALCSGDANDNNLIQSSDVTYLVSFFRGLIPPPIPSCDLPPCMQ